MINIHIHIDSIFLLKTDRKYSTKSTEPLIPVMRSTSRRGVVPYGSKVVRSCTACPHDKVFKNMKHVLT